MVKAGLSGSPVIVISSEKQTYSYDDILALKFENRTFIVNKPIGQKFMIENEYECVVNPFNVTENDALLEYEYRYLLEIEQNLLLIVLSPHYNLSQLNLPEVVPESRQEINHLILQRE